MSSKNSPPKKRGVRKPIKTIDELYVVGIDVAPLHLAIRGERFNAEGCVPLLFDLISMGNKKIDRSFFKTLTDYLDTKDWTIYNLVLIEGQMVYMGFGKGNSPSNARIQTFLETYFLLRFPQVQVEIIPARSKYPPELKGKKSTDYHRKKWSIQKMLTIFEERNDQESLSVMKDAKKVSKMDDLAEACILILVYLKNNHKKFSFDFEKIF